MEKRRVNTNILKGTLRQWEAIVSKEMGISEDLRKQDVLSQAVRMVANVKEMIRTGYYVK